MKILYLFYNDGRYIFEWQIKHIVNEMSFHDCSIELINPADYPDVNFLNDKILELINEGSFDIFMTCLTDKYIYVETLKRIHIKKLLFCPDNLVVPYNHRSVCKYFDLVWLTSIETAYLFKRWGANFVFLPYAANPFLLKPLERDCDDEILRVAFVGTPHGSRVRTINFLLRNQIPVTIFTSNNALDNRFIKSSFKNYIRSFLSGLRFKTGIKLSIASLIDKLTRPKIISSQFLEIKEPVSLNLISDVYSKYALVLSFAEANSTGVLKRPVDIVNLRNFEIPMAGGLQFCRYTKEMANYFNNEEEIVMYKNKKEMIKKAIFFLDKEQESRRAQIRRMARNRSLSEHTWYNRFSVIFKELEMK